MDNDNNNINRPSPEAVNNNRLNRLLEITEENNRLLRKIHHLYILKIIYKIIYIIVVIGILIFVYHSLKPVYTKVKNNYQGIIEPFLNTSNASSSASNSILNSIQQYFNNAPETE